MDDTGCQKPCLRVQNSTQTARGWYSKPFFFAKPRNSNPLTANSVNISCDIEGSREGWVEQQKETNKWAKQIILGQFFLEIPKPELFGHRGGDSLTSPYPLAFFGGDQKICMKNWMWSFGSHRIFFSGKSVNGYITKTRNNLHSKRPLDCSCWISRSCFQPRKFVKIICLTQNQQHPIKKRGLFKGEPKTCLV